MCVASILHYEFIEHCRYQDSDFCDEGNIDFLRSKVSGFFRYSSYNTASDQIQTSGRALSHQFGVFS